MASTIDDELRQGVVTPASSDEETVRRGILSPVDVARLRRAHAEALKALSASSRASSDQRCAVVAEIAKIEAQMVELGIPVPHPLDPRSMVIA